MSRTDDTDDDCTVSDEPFRFEPADYPIARRARTRTRITRPDVFARASMRDIIAAGSHDAMPAAGVEVELDPAQLDELLISERPTVRVPREELHRHARVVATGEQEIDAPVARLIATLVRALRDRPAARLAVRFRRTRRADYAASPDGVVTEVRK